MNTIKRMALVLATVGMVSTQAYAGESAVKMTPLSPQLSAFSQDDINSMFEASGKPMQLAALSTQEMKDTEGAWGPVGAIIGGLGGLGGYTLNAMISGSRWSPGAALTSTALARMGWFGDLTLQEVEVLRQGYSSEWVGNPVCSPAVRSVDFVYCLTVG